ncbi:hypothetical protein NP233_g7217 [Leucocoprinus birnbaumii]|uniref:Cytochrome P450 n=1 Tax=Leucocoprinus birnbaumii TaxID=56174 RepID=A0AAD5VQQ9_9AGAR|nr:hypothetical protein NP233_g7217 [Leucocoprinus birnbaumii]
MWESKPKVLGIVGPDQLLTTIFCVNVAALPHGNISEDQYSAVGTTSALHSATLSFLKMTEDQLFIIFPLDFGLTHPLDCPSTVFMATQFLQQAISWPTILNSSDPNMNALIHFLSPLALTLGTFSLYKLSRLIWREYVSNPLKGIPGPPSPSWFYGNMRQIREGEIASLHEGWVKEYGTTIKFKVFFGVSRLFTMDLKALNHVMMNSQIYYKPDQAKSFLSRLVGDGVLVTEGSKHREQNPAFGAAQIRELTEIFVEKALELRDVWIADVEKQAQGVKPQARINVMTGLSKMTLDVIGLAGFDYKFNSLSGEKNELNEAFSMVFNSRLPMPFLFVLRTMLGRLGSFLVPLPGDKPRRQARATMERIGKQLLTESRTALEQVEGEKDERFRKRDLLSLLLKANMSADVHQRMSDEDVLAQVPTFLVAGHETTSNATTWALHALSLNPQVQSKLRDELFTIDTENPTMDELNALPYLDAVVRETLRVHAPVPGTARVAIKDDIVPLDTPFVDRNGKVRDSLLIRKGQTITIPILAINRSEQIWGPDAREFKPERWESPPEAASGIPGVWGHMLTFLGGPRACIGFRFSLVEMKVLLFTLIRAFEFEPAVPVHDVGTKSTVVQRPFLISEPKAGVQMPLLMKRYVRVD